MIHYIPPDGRLYHCASWGGGSREPGGEPRPGPGSRRRRRHHAAWLSAGLPARPGRRGFQWPWAWVSCPGLPPRKELETDGPGQDFGCAVAQHPPLVGPEGDSLIEGSK